MIALTKGGAVEAHGHLVCSLGILMSGAESDLEGSSVGVPLHPTSPSRETAALALSCRGHTAEVTSGSSSIHRLALSLPFACTPI